MRLHLPPPPLFHKKIILFYIFDWMSIRVTIEWKWAKIHRAKFWIFFFAHCVLQKSCVTKNTCLKLILIFFLLFKLVKHPFNYMPHFLSLLQKTEHVIGSRRRSARSDKFRTEFRRPKNGRRYKWRRGRESGRRERSWPEAKYMFLWRTRRYPL